MLLFELSQKVFSIFKEARQFSRRLRESTFKVISSPLNSMLDLVREVFQSTKRDTFLRRIDNVSITDCNMWDNNLRMTFSSESS
jgi:hypothetical protein